MYQTFLELLGLRPWSCASLAALRTRVGALVLMFLCTSLQQARALDAELIADIHSSLGAPTIGTACVTENYTVVTADAGVEGFEPYLIDRATGVATLIGDLNPGTASSALQSSGSLPCVEFNGRLYLSLAISASERALISTRGAASNTRTEWVYGTGMVRPIGEANGKIIALRTGTQRDLIAFDPISKAVTSLAAAPITPTYIRGYTTHRNGSLYFFISGAFDGTFWKTDGTPQGTVQFAAQISRHTARDNFVAELPAGLIVALGPLTQDSLALFSFESETFSPLAKTRVLLPTPGAVVARAGDKAVFIGITLPDTGATSLWTTDGTDAGTEEIFMLSQSGGLGTQSQLVSVGNDAYFVNAESANSSRNALWKSDGTAPGTTTVSIPDSGFDLKPSLTGGGDYLFLLEDRQQFDSDGVSYTEQQIEKFNTTTRTVDDFYRAPRGTSIYYSLPFEMLSLFMLREDTEANGMLIGRHDSLALLTVNVPRETTAASTPRFLGQVDAGIVMLADDGTHGRELWLTDGTAAHTRLIADLEPGSKSFSEREPQRTTRRGVTIGSQLIFINCTAAKGCELWRTDGTAAGTIGYQELEGAFIDSVYRLLVPINGRLLVAGRGNGQGEALLAAPTTQTQLITIADSLPEMFQQEIRGAALLGNVAYVGITDIAVTSIPALNRLVRTDGTPAGTTIFDPFPSAANVGQLLDTREVNGRILLFTKTDTAGTIALWSSGGTAGDAQFVRNLAVTATTSDLVPGYRTAAGFIFQQNKEIWVTDGSPAGTRMLASFDSYPLVRLATSETLPRERVEFGLVRAIEGSTTEYWRVDGTQQGTQLVRTMPTANGGGQTLQSQLPASATIIETLPEFGTEMWVTDGIANPFLDIVDINPGTASSNPRDTIEYRGEVLVAATRAGVSEELFRVLNWRCTIDTDGDGIGRCQDQCADDPRKADPGVCGCGVGDDDPDGDGAPSCVDACSSDPAKTHPGQCGCGVADTDTDLDGALDCIDQCITDPAKTLPGECGCGVADSDTDLDGALDCRDLCITDPRKVGPGVCGCGVGDDDPDGDGVPSCVDACSSDPAKTLPGQCGCGVADTDSDLDGAPDCIDQCITDPAKTDSQGCGCGVPDQDLNGDGALDCFVTPLNSLTPAKACFTTKMRKPKHSGNSTRGRLTISLQPFPAGVSSGLYEVEYTVRKKIKSVVGARRAKKRAPKVVLNKLSAPTLVIKRLSPGDKIELRYRWRGNEANFSAQSQATTVQIRKRSLNPVCNF